MGTKAGFKVWTAGSTPAHGLSETLAVGRQKARSELDQRLKGLAEPQDGGALAALTAKSHRARMQ